MAVPLHTNDPSLVGILTRLGQAYRAGARQRVALRLLTLGLLTLWLLVVGDAFLPLPGAGRILLLLSAVLALAMATKFQYRRFTAARSFDRMLARQLEQAEPALGNTLINALDFQSELAGEKSRDLSHLLMEQEVARAAVLSSAPALGQHLRRSGLRPEKQRLALAAVASAILMVLLWPILQAVIPRYLDPWGDHPPFHPTRLQVSPGDAVVDYGDSLDVEVISRGPQPRQLHLVVSGTNGLSVTRLPVYESAPGHGRQTVENITGERVYYAAMEGGRSPRYRITVAPAPRLDTTQVRYEYPAYTRLRTQTRFLTDRIIRAYAGTWVTLLLTANRPLRGGTVTVNGVAHPAQPTEEERTVSTRFLLTSAGTFEASLVDTEGAPSREPLRGQLELVPDRAPEVAVVSPGVDAFATPSAQVPLNIEARDDLGVKSIKLFCRLNDGPDTRRVLWESDGGQPFAQATPVFDFADLGVRPGEVVDYYVTATDTDPDQPHTAASPAYRLKIISEEDYRTLMQGQTTADELRRHYDEWTERLQEMAEEQRRIAEELAALRAQEQPLDAQQQARLADLEAQQEALANEASALAEEMRRTAESPAVFDVERDFKKRLGKLAGQIAEAAAEMQQGAQAIKAGGAAADQGTCKAALDQSAAHQQKALELMGQGAEQYDSSVGDAAREIEEVFALFADVEQFKYLLARQQDVERQSASLQNLKDINAETQARLRELAEAQLEIQTAFDTLREDLAAHAEPVAKDYPKVAADARALAERMAELDISGHMKEAALAFQAQTPQPGHAAAKQALDDMESLVSRCQGAGGEKECELRLSISMNMALGQTFSQLAQALSSGEGQGPGGGGGVGQRGSQGGGMQQAFQVYGDSAQANPTRRGAGLGRRPRDLPPEATPPGLTATDTEEISVTKDREITTRMSGEEGFMTDYETLIRHYFRRMAEE